MIGSEAERVFRESRRIAIVGASLAGLRAAETLRAEGFAGRLTLIGDEPYEPYDRPPLSKQVLTGWVAADHTSLARRRALDDVEWCLGVPAVGLDLVDRHVRLADGQQIAFDRVLIATGARARPWPNPAEAALDGVHVLRTRDDAARLRRHLADGPRRVLVVGGGFIGCEVASSCRELGLSVTVVVRGPTPLHNALGATIGDIAADLQRRSGVDLRCGITVSALDGNADGRLRRAHLSDGSAIDVDVAVVALGVVRNTEWLNGSGLAAGAWGVACDAACRALDVNGVVIDDVFAAGDVALFPHLLYGYQLLAFDHWANAVEGAEVAAHNMLSGQSDRRPHSAVPAFWSSQFGVNIKSVGAASLADEVVVAQGSVEDRRFTAVYGRRGRIVAAVAFDQAKWLPFYQGLVEAGAPFPPAMQSIERPSPAAPMAARFPGSAVDLASLDVILTGSASDGRRAASASKRQ